MIEPEPDDPKALRFDALLYGIELAYLAGKPYTHGRNELLKKAKAVASVSNIPEIDQKRALLEKLIQTDYIKTADVNEFEHIRKELRNLIKYIPIEHVRYDTDFSDEILSTEWKEVELENDDLKNYKTKAEYYVRQHQDNAAIAKLKGNIPLTAEDVKELEKILWSEVGTKENYEAEYGTKPLGEFVREIVGLDMAAAKAAFSQYLDGANLDSRQIYFVNQIVEYIVHNGTMKDLSGNRQISRRIKKHLWLSNRSWARDVHSFGILHSWGALAGKSCSAQASSIWLIAGAFRRTQSK